MTKSLIIESNVEKSVILTLNLLNSTKLFAKKW